MFSKSNDKTMTVSIIQTNLLQKFNEDIFGGMD